MKNKNIVLIKYCCVCQQRTDFISPGFLCELCFLQCKGLQIFSEPVQPMISFYEYREPIRQIVLNAKIGKCFFSLKTMEDLLMKHPIFLALKLPHKTLVPAASSIWSRWRGSIDVAHHLANMIAKKFRLHLQYPSWEDYWKFKKQSFRDRKNENYISYLTNDHSQIGNKILVDDVLTSGFTLFQLKKHFPNDVFKMMTFASAQK